jgi:hypothetical protein
VAQAQRALERRAAQVVHAVLEADRLVGARVLSIANGGGVAVFRIRTSSASTSTSPVGSFVLTVSGERRCTRPRTRTTYSERSAPAFS